MCSAAVKTALEDAVALGREALFGVVLVDGVAAGVPLLGHCWDELIDSFLCGGLPVTSSNQPCSTPGAPAPPLEREALGPRLSEFVLGLREQPLWSGVPLSIASTVARLVLSAAVRRSSGSVSPRVLGAYSARASSGRRAR